jgi:hypothetical protein
LPDGSVARPFTAEIHYAVDLSALISLPTVVKLESGLPLAGLSEAEAAALTNFANYAVDWLYKGIASAGGVPAALHSQLPSQLTSQLHTSRLRALNFRGSSGHPRQAGRWKKSVFDSEHTSSYVILLNWSVRKFAACLLPR